MHCFCSGTAVHLTYCIMHWNDWIMFCYALGWSPDMADEVIQCSWNRIGIYYVYPVYTQCRRKANLPDVYFTRIAMSGTILSQNIRLEWKWVLQLQYSKQEHISMNSKLWYLHQQHMWHFSKISRMNNPHRNAVFMHQEPVYNLWLVVFGVV